jgi:dihydrofolate reductase
MRKLILSMQVSLDGFVEGQNGDMSWMQPDDNEQWDDMFAMLLKNVDLLLLGRGMWADYRDYWKKALVDSNFSPNEVKFAKLAERTPHIVFSKTLKDAGWENTTINSGDVADEVKKIKEQSGKDIYIVGGAKFAATLIDSGLVDEYQLVINPVILTKGKSFFQQLTNRRQIELIDTKQLSTGVAILRYKQVNIK